MFYKNIALISSNKEKAVKLKELLLGKYPAIKEFNLKKSNDYDLIIVLGGDGFMLKTIHVHMDLNIPFYGLNCGKMGFLMNKFNEQEDVLGAINKAKALGINHLEADIVDVNGKSYKDIAINEVSLFRSTHQIVKIKIDIDGITRMEELLSDGVLVSTVIGSGAYNFSANGSILPLNSGVLSLIPISPFRPRRWAGAILDNNSIIKLTVIDAEDRKVSLMSDYIEVPNIKSVEIKTNKKKTIEIMFNEDLPLNEKIIQEQFSGY